MDDAGTAALPPFSVFENGGMSAGQGGCQAGLASIVENVKALKPYSSLKDSARKTFTTSGSKCRPVCSRIYWSATSFCQAFR